MKLSIIIPVLNEAKALPATLDCVERLAGQSELIVVDGGSTDASKKIAAAVSRVRLISADRGRARQMNAGADVACGDWLLFLHADSLLPEDAADEILALDANSSVQAGCFRHRFSGNNFLLSLISRLHNWRFSRGGIIYGDQALFVRRDLFRKIGGYPQVSILEDVQFSEQLVKTTRPIMLDQTVVTDSRKFIQRGVFRCFLEIALILTCHELRLPIKGQGFFRRYDSDELQ